jgi:carboxyl-terminal processing protease
MTDGGRTVYGGGGISPDEKFTPEKLTPSRRNCSSSSRSPNFTQHFFAGPSRKTAAGWNVDTKTMDEFHNWLLDQKIEFTEADFTKDYDKDPPRLQAEIYKTAFSVDEAMKYDTKTDPEVEAGGKGSAQGGGSAAQRA